jgi:hypothetical protein
MFGFNTQEKVNEIAGVGNHNTAKFWEYDTRLGRRWNLDPVDQVNISNYACLGNNPISMVDFAGNQFNKAEDKKLAEDTKSAIDTKAKDYRTAESADNKKMAEIQGTKSLSDISSWNRKDRNAYNRAKSSASLNGECASIMEKASQELETMISVTDQNFAFQKSSGWNNALNTSVQADGTILMQYSNSANRVHELTHGHQIYKGTSGYKSNYDITDEISAYQRQFIFDPIGYDKQMPAVSIGLIGGSGGVQLNVSSYTDITAEYIRNIPFNEANLQSFYYKDLPNGPLPLYSPQR